MKERKIRRKSRNDRNRRGKRYQDTILKSGYGRTSMLQAAESEEEQEIAWQKMQKRNRMSFMMRGFFSVLLFVIVLLMRFAGLKIGSVDYQNLVSSLRSEEFVNGIDLEELLPDMEAGDEDQM